LALARADQTRTRVTAPAIAEQQRIPEKYLVHILLQLKRAGIVRSIRGAQGGYLLARPAEEVTLYDVVSAIDGAPLDPLPVSDPASNDLAPTWRAIAERIRRTLTKITFRDILDRTTQGEMYYI